jgi:beta-glucanase (GH16 family)
MAPLALVCAQLACSSEPEAPSGVGGASSGFGGGGQPSSGGGVGVGAASGSPTTSGASSQQAGSAAGGRGGTSAGTGGVSANGGVSAAAASGGASTQAGRGGEAGGAGGDAAPDGWKLSWSDEFAGENGEKPDSTKWGYDLGGDGWGNNELEYYTDRPENAATDGQGHLLITLKSEKMMNRDYTSARLITLGKFDQSYGRFEARIKIPKGVGVWPAFWMLGADIKTNAWPNCGEIDIMENAGKAPRVNHGSLHGPGYSGGNPLTGTYTLPSGALADDFHLYAVEWEQNVVRWYVDRNLYETRKNTDVPSGGTWVYDHPFFMILNVAIGGSFGGAPDSTTMLPQSMTVDYVRVYERQ